MSRRNTIDFNALKEEIRRSVVLSSIIGRTVDLKKTPSGEYVGLCPFHGDTKPSLSVNDQKGFFYCRSCGTGGDIFTYLQKTEGKSFMEVLTEFSDGHVEVTGQAIRKQDVTKGRDAAEEVTYEVLLPPTDAPALVPERRGFDRYAFKEPRTIPIKSPRRKDVETMEVPVARLHAYRDHAGRLMRYVVRSEWTDPAGKRQKATMPVVWARHPDGEEAWTFGAFPEPRLPYGLEHLAREDATHVIVVEGEKAADIGNDRYGDAGFVFLSWCGGSKAIAKTDWSALAGKMVLLSPDNDHQGFEAMAWLAGRLAELQCEAHALAPPAGSKKGWDIADTDWTVDQLRDWLQDSSYAAEEFFARQEPEYEIPADPGASASSTGAPQPKRETPKREADRTPDEQLENKGVTPDMSHSLDTVRGAASVATLDSGLAQELEDFAVAADDEADEECVTQVLTRRSADEEAAALLEDIQRGPLTPVILNRIRRLRDENDEVRRALFRALRQCGVDTSRLNRWLMIDNPAALELIMRAELTAEEIVTSGLLADPVSFADSHPLMVRLMDMYDQNAGRDFYEAVRDLRHYAPPDSEEQVEAMITAVRAASARRKHGLVRRDQARVLSVVEGTATAEAQAADTPNTTASGPDTQADDSSESGGDDGTDDGIDPPDQDDLAAQVGGITSRALGFNRQTYYYLSDITGEIIAVKAEQHRERTLLQLAPLSSWRMAFPSVKGDSVDWVRAADYMMSKCHRAGIFDPDRVRGRGAWVEEEDQVILHLGDRLIVGGREVGLDEHHSKYHYERALELPAPSFDNPLTDEEGSELLGIFTKLRWEDPASAYLLAGWVAISMICGAVYWRPHAWLTGGSGSGKSWVLTHIISRLLQDVALFIQSTSSEAGIRQSLQADARPIVFDEAESEDEKGKHRMQSILELARQASSETGGDIRKGSGNQVARSYRIRSMFLFASIGVALKQQADKNRVTILSLAKPPEKWETERRAEADRHFQQLRDDVRRIITPETSRRLFARMINLIPTVRANTAVCAQVGAKLFGSQRLGDQVGVLLAGAAALSHDMVMSVEEAEEFFNDIAVERHLYAAQETDERRCLEFLMGATISVTSHNQARLDRTIGELVLAVFSAGSTDAFLTDDTARQVLGRIGIKIVLDPDGTGQDYMVIHNNLPALERILRDSPWSVGWSNILRNLDGAWVTADPVRFSPGLRGRGVCIPRSTIFGDADTETLDLETVS